ncbi:Cyclin-dependent kinase 11B [Parelaphostrongylus tenuis]|uniref:Cyclin-dependent kinase 11B n=1 Tax=Parelaphostrongylus tenuis TaxID=148309 RepID=A0AAD5MXB9_PARTN|nr:Cyclin-dependent kinase 11B [Parelaphostrongylus tenuis]
MGEFVHLKPLFPGNEELDEISKISMELGTLSECIWDGYNDLPGPKMMKLDNFPHNQLRKKFPAAVMSEIGFKLLKRYLVVGYFFKFSYHLLILSFVHIRFYLSESTGIGFDIRSFCDIGYHF